MRVTIRDIASSLNVSHTTVSRVLNGRGKEFISETTRQKVLAAAAKMNYHPNHAARALATGRTHMIALWIGNIYLPYFVNAMHYAEIVSQQHEYDMIIRRMHRPQEHSEHWQVDGILAFDGPDYISEFLDANPSSGPPIVSMGSYYCERVDFVGVDLYAGALEGVRHLVNLGCRRIAYFLSEWGNRVGDARYDAYMTVMKETGRQPELIPIPKKPANARILARRTLTAYVRAKGCPDGLFCFSDDVAIGGYRGLCDLGIRVPDEVAMFGCDGIEDMEYFECPLSTVQHPYEEMCTLAWQFLARRMQDPSIPLQQALLTPQFVIRESMRR